VTPAIRIRAAERDDVGAVLELIAELAEYEHAADQVKGTEELLLCALFGPEPSAEALVAELEGVTAGFALFYRTFSTWECRPGIWLEDLYIKPEHRRAGIGQALLGRLARIALERGYARLEWAALDWNDPALRFYEQLGARVLDEWRMLRLDGAALERVGSAPAPEP
jgi:GNAT superfamily N-acetyltransferase